MYVHTNYGKIIVPHSGSTLQTLSVPISSAKKTEKLC